MNGRNYGEKNHDEQYEKRAAGCSGLRTDPAGRGNCLCPVAAGSHAAARIDRKRSAGCSQDLSSLGTEG